MVTKNSNPNWAIIICTFGRRDRFFQCLTNLVWAVKKNGEPIQLIVMDNNPLKGLKKMVEIYLEESRLIRFRYIHDAISNQSELRNKSLKFILSSVNFLFFLDSDIYVAKLTILKINTYLKYNKEVKAVAPPLLSYVGGRQEIYRNKNKKNIQNGGDCFIMPDRSNYLISKKNGQLLQTNMLRGAFVVRKNILKRFFGKNPWHPVFKVWQNVPFFLTLKEKNVSFGYLLDDDIIALHDDRPHRDAIKSSMELWHSETIKSIILLFYRNELWKHKHQKNNGRFINVMKAVLSNHSTLAPNKNIYYSFQVAKILSKRDLIVKKLTRLSDEIEDAVFKTAIKLLLNCNQSEMRVVRSRDYERPV